MTSEVSIGQSTPSHSELDQSGGDVGRPPQAEPFLRGCAFAAVGDVPYPRVLGTDVGRLPADTWASAQVPVGVRIELAGTAPQVEVAYTCATDSLGYRGEGAGTTFTVWSGDRLLAEEPAQVGAHTLTLPLAEGLVDGVDRVTLHLPEGMRPTIVSVTGVGGDVVAPSRQPRWLCYGDSIAEGWVSSGPAYAWPAVAGRRFQLDVVNLAYAAAARGEMVMAEVMADLPADVISISHGTNCWTRIQHRADQVAVGLDAFLDLVRSGHPDTPVVVASPVLRPDAEATPNRVGSTLADIRVAMEAVVRTRIDAGDDRLHLVAGGELLRPDQLPDGVHPGDEGHIVLADTIGGAVARSLAATRG